GVRPMGDVLVGAPEDRVVDGGGELTDASAHAHGHLSTGDDRCGQIALGSGAATDHRVQVEYLAREYDVPVECPGQTLDVLHPILTAGVVGRVPRHQVHTGPGRRGEFGQAERPGDECGHLATGHVVVGAEQGVVGWVAAPGDVGLGQGVDLALEDVLIIVREPVLHGRIRQLQGADQQGGHLSPVEVAPGA